MAQNGDQSERMNAEVSDDNDCQQSAQNNNDSDKSVDSQMSDSKCDNRVINDNNSDMNVISEDIDSAFVNGNTGETDCNSEAVNSVSNSNSNMDSDFKSRSSDDEEDSLLSHDPTPSVAYPPIKWYSLQQLQHREYGNLMKPGVKHSFNKFDSQWFRRYAYNSLYFFQRLELMGKFEEHSGCVNCLNFNSSGDLLCSGSDDLRIAIWDWQKSRLKTTYHSGHSSNVFQCRWCIDNHHIVSSARDGQIRICNITRNSSISRKLAQHKGAAHKITFNAPQVVLSCGDDAAVFEIDLRADKPTKLLVVKNENQRVPLYSIHCNMVFNPLQFAISGRDPRVLIYDRRFLPTAESATVRPVLTLCPEHLSQSRHTVTCMQYNSTADTIVATYNDEDIYTFNAKTGSVENVYRGHRNSATVKGCSWFGDDFIVSGSDDGYVYGWERSTQHIVMSVYADENGVVNCIEPHPTAPIIATSGLDDNVKIWVPSANEWPQTLKGIKQRICTNIKDRKVSHRRLAEFDDDDPIDSSMLYLIISHMRRQRHSQRRRTGGNTSNTNDDDDNDDDTNDDLFMADDDDDDDSDSDSDADARRQCIQS